MVSVRFFGISRIKFQEKGFECECGSVKELCEIIAKRYNVPVKEVKQFLIFVNDVNIVNLKTFRTPLKDGDKLMFLSPSSGG